jgi:hypothetical protein
MSRYQVQAPDGHTYEFEAPDDATPQQLDAMTREVAGYGKKYPVTAPEPEAQKPAPAAPEAHGLGQQLLDNTVNDLAGIAQGAAALPDMAASGVGKILSAIPNLIGEGLSAAGHEDAAKWIQENITHPLANPMQVGDIIETASPTPDTTQGHVDRFIGQMVGGAATVPASAMESAAARIVGQAPKSVIAAPTVAPAAQEAAQAAGDLGIDLPRFVVGGTKDAKKAAALEQTAFGAGPIKDATGKMLTQSEAQRSAIAAKVGAVSDAALLGDQTLDAAVKSNKGRRAAIGTLYKYARTASDGVEIAPKQSLDSIDNLLIEEATKIGGSKIAPVLQNFRDDLANAGKITVDQARDLRTNLREMLTSEAGSTPSNADRITNQVMQAVNGDMKTGLPGDAFATYKQADTAWAQQRSLEDDVLKPFLGKDFDSWGEDVAKKINSDAKGNGTRLARFLSALPEEQANNIRASLINRLGNAGDGAQNASGDAFSLDTFLTNWNQLKGSRNLIFGKDTTVSLDKLAKIAEVAKGYGRNRNFSNTGGVVSALLHSVPTTVGIVGSTLTHDPKEVLLGVLASGLTAARQFGAAKLLASPDFARKLAATPLNLKGAQAFWSRPWVKAMAVKNPTIAAELQAFQYKVLNGANDNVVPAAAASPDANEQDQQQQAQP